MYVMSTLSIHLDPDNNLKETQIKLSANFHERNTLTSVPHVTDLVGSESDTVSLLFIFTNFPESFQLGIHVRAKFKKVKHKLIWTDPTPLSEWYIPTQVVELLFVMCFSPVPSVFTW